MQTWNDTSGGFFTMKCKRIISIIMAALCLLTMSGAFAYKVGEARVAIGANLDSEQIAAA